jgi:hypothetical protein
VALHEVEDPSKRHLVWIDPNMRANHLVALDFLPARIVNASDPLYIGLSPQSGALEWEKEDGHVVRGIPDGFGSYFDITDADLQVREFFRYRPNRLWLPVLTRPDSVTPEAALAQEVFGATWEPYLTDEDRVLGLTVGNESRAYPVKVLKYHEIVNDEIGDESVTVVYSPLSGSGMAYRARVGDGTATFGHSGLLYNSTPLIYDATTMSLWSHFDGLAVAGPEKGERLDVLPVIQTTWKTWHELHPDSLVLSASTGYQRMLPYNRDPYQPDFRNDYYADERLVAPIMLPDGTFAIPLATIADPLSNKAWVVGIRGATDAIAYPVSELAQNEANPLPVEFDGRALEIHYNPDVETGFVLGPDGNVLDDATLSLWFAWKTFFPATEVYFAGKSGTTGE